MNERIEQLKKQAHIEHRQEYFSSVVDPTIKSVSVTRHFDLNLFAELIVGECANVLQKEIKTAIAHDGKETHIDLILIEHFGVEE